MTGWGEDEKGIREGGYEDTVRGCGVYENHVLFPTSNRRSWMHTLRAILLLVHFGFWSMFNCGIGILALQEYRKEEKRARQTGLK